MEYELINTEGLQSVVIGDRTIEFATVTQEELAFMYKKQSRYVQVKAAPEPGPLADLGITSTGKKRS